MGCDGGTIPRRDELVRTKKKPEKVERDIENAAKWKYCALTQLALREPIVACYLGRLFNKEALIEALLDKTIGEKEKASHIRGLKDVKTLNLTKNSSFDTSKADKGDVYKDYNVAQFICPVVGIEMNGKHKFCVIWSCGCVISEKALKEVKSDVCHKCGKAYKQEDVIVLNGTDEEVEELRSRKEKQRETQQATKSKKQAQNGTASSNVVSNVDDEPSTSGVQYKSNDAVSSSKKADSKTATKRKDVSVDETVKSKKTKSIQNDPGASKVYKSLFTSSDEAKNRPTAHWVTYNPLYY